MPKNGWGVLLTIYIDIAIKQGGWNDCAYGAKVSELLNLEDGGIYLQIQYTNCKFYQGGWKNLRCQ